MSLSIYNARLLDPASNLDEVGAIYVDRGKFQESLVLMFRVIFDRTKIRNTP